MNLKFTKVHSAGNDFLVIDGIRQSVALSPEHVRFLADRHFGVGCDHVLLIENTLRDDADFRYRLFDNQGNESSQCADAARCFMRFVHEKRLSHKQEITVETKLGLLIPRLGSNGHITVEIAAPQIDARILDLGSDVLSFQLAVLDQMYAVGEVSEINEIDIVTLHAQLTQQVPSTLCTTLMQVVNRSHVRLRTYRTQQNELLSDSMGACAAVAVGQYHNTLDDVVQVATHGGTLMLSKDIQRPVMYVTGSVILVFDGEINL